MARALAHWGILQAAGARLGLRPHPAMAIAAFLICAARMDGLTDGATV
jgi:hypothetical protein